MSRKKKIILGVIIFFAIWFVVAGVLRYLEWRYDTRFERGMAEVNKEIDDWEKKLAKDTIGGATPQETLEMFIEAVERGDYELASKYFVVEKQEEEFKKINNIDSDRISFLLGVLNQIEADSGFFSGDKTLYTIKEPIFIEFIKYPSGNWKIDEI